MIDWKTEPNSLVGKRVDIKWANGKFYSGRVTRYIPSLKEHVVAYDDGQEIQYDMHIKTFRIEGDGTVYHPNMNPPLATQGAYGRYAGHNPAYSSGYAPGGYGQINANYSSWYGGYSSYGSSAYSNVYGAVPSGPFTSRVPGATTDIIFHVRLDTNVLLPGDRLLISGNIAELRDVEMFPSIHNPTIFTAAVTLPYALTDNHIYGLFHYQYVLVSSGERIPEGQPHRSDQQLKQRYFHCFRPNYTNSRFRNITISPSIENLRAYINFLLSEVEITKSISLCSVLHVAQELFKDFPEASRQAPESVLGAYLDHCGRENITPRTHYVCILLAMVGSFGKTSNERLPQYISYIGMQPQTSAATFKDPPSPSQWCHYIADHLPVASLFEENWREMYGDKFMNIVHGIAEAIERLSEHGFYNWLRIMPIVLKHNVSVRIVHKTKKKRGKKKKAAVVLGVDERFTEMAHVVCALIEGLAIEKNIISEGESDSAHRELVRMWINALISYSPSMSNLVFLISMKIIPNEKDIIPGIVDRIKDEDFNESSFSTLKTLLEMPFLRCVDVAIALLQNDSFDDLHEDVMDLVQECVNVQDHPFSQDGDTEAKTGDLHGLTVAAKEWIRRRYALEPHPSVIEEKKDFYSGLMTAWVTTPVNKVKKLTQEEQIAQRRECLTNALFGVNKLLSIPFFVGTGESIFFELNRCWFFKGHVLSVLDALCWVGRNDIGYQIYCDALTSFLDKQVCLLFKEVGSQACDAIDCITSVLSASNPLLQYLLYKLSLSTSWGHESPEVEPSLVVLLENCLFWRKIHAWSQPQFESLNSLMHSIRKVFMKIVYDIMENTILLPLLQTIRSHEMYFLDFITMFKLEASFDRTRYEDRKRRLRDFDMSIMHMQTYVSYFCSCGVRIESMDIRRTVEAVQNKYNITKLCDVNNSFSSVLAFAHVEWLYNLRKSELFLQQWRECGRNVIIDSIEGARAALDGNHDADDILFDIPLQENMSEEAIQRIRDLDADRFHRQDHQNRLIQMVNEQELTQEMVVNSLIPRVNELWRDLSVQTLTGNISLSKLDEVFSSLKTEAQVREELHMLSQSDFSGTALKGIEISRLIDRAISGITDYMLLRKLKKWLPSLVSLQQQCPHLFKCADDAFYLRLQRAIHAIRTHENVLLNDIPELVSELRPIFSPDMSEHLDYLSLLSSSPNLLEWLHRQSSTEEFNRLLQVVRPCTDEPRLLSAIASLVHTRNVLLPLIYVNDPYDDMASMLSKLQLVELSGDDKDNALWHLNNIIDAFDSLMDMCERQTRSPGIKSCYDLKELLQYGTFIMCAGSDPTNVLTVHIAKNNELRVEQLDYLFDLRSKLLMTEIPPEVEADLQVADAINSFVSQLLILVEITDILVQLTVSGHSKYQDGYKLKEKFVHNGETGLHITLKSLQVELQEWEKAVYAARSSFFYLNFFTMREILRIQTLLHDMCYAPVPNCGETAQERQSDINAPFTVEADVEKVRLLQDWSVPRHWAIYSLSHTNNDVSAALDFCSSNSHMMEKLITDANIPRDLDEVPLDIVQYHPDKELLSLLHLVYYDVEMASVDRMAAMWKDSGESETVLVILGTILDEIFCQHAMPSRKISLPTANAENVTDMLFTVDEDPENKLPVYAASTENRLTVIDTVLSVYIRRARIPTPGEIIFCCSSTTTEELDLLLLRFIYAKNIGFGHGIFTIADLHNLTYTQQCWLVERIKFLFSSIGHGSAAILLLVSGVSKQVAFNSLSTHIIELPPLSKDELRISIAEAFRKHCGETVCVLSTINGGGKSQYIMSEISYRQEVEPLVYCKIPLREKTTAGDLLNLLSALQPRPLACHLDIAHVIPAIANTLLFQLLFIGVLRDPNSCRVYFRRKCDVFYLELPNSTNNATAFALRFCNLLPFRILDVCPDTLQLQRPYCVRSESAKIRMVDYAELLYVCKWLRAIDQNQLKDNGGYAPSVDEQITKSECYTLLYKICNRSDKSPYASWCIFHNFVVFLCMQFQALERYPLLQGNILADTGGLESFKGVFINLLVETSADFALRSVPQISNVGPQTDAINIADRENGLEGIVANNDIHSAPGLNRQTSDDVVMRFQYMTSWNDTEHPIVAFNTDRVYDTVTGVAILSLNSSYLHRYIHGELKAALIENGINLDRDWSKITNEEGVAILRGVEGLSSEHYGGDGAIEDGYVLTVDNMLKMLSIQLRLRYNLPVIIMGETGVGKSAVIRNMCAVLGYPLHTLNIHGGTTDEDVIHWMERKIRIANEIRDPFVNVIVFLDEINTCNSMGLFKEICCDRTMNGKILPEKLKIIAACNPYRLRTSKSLYGGEEMAGLIFEHFTKASYVENVGTGIKDPLRNLVYRVHPLPESIIDHVFDFGSLTSETESIYVKAMLRKQLGLYNDSTNASTPLMNPFEEFVEVFAELICESQECVRRLADGERSSTSLRDVARCVRVFLWFGNHFANTKGPQEKWTLDHFYQISPICHKYIRKAVILSLAYCYHARLPRPGRRQLINAITNKWRSMQGVEVAVYTSYSYSYSFQQLNPQFHRPRCRWLNLEYSAFLSILQDTQLEFVSVMKLGEGIALNEALCENLFMILVSVLNNIPIFVVGKPGSSKSLAMGLIQSNLNGEASDNEFLRTMPAVEVFSYQCSPLSTSSGIEKAFESARRYLKEASNTVVVVLLDEVGLAEQSPHLPLKVLHKVFDEARHGESVVSISNWALDPAKMNRAVHLYRPAPTVEDLSRTAEGMVRSANLKGYLHQLAKAYDTVYQQQEHPDFWGLREFYSTVRAINTALAANTNDSAIDDEILLHAVLRNFGGRPNEMNATLSCFFNFIGLTVPANWKSVSVESLIVRNLHEYDARHMMLLTRNNAALSLLLDRGILKHDRTEIIFGSDFPLDQNDLQVCMNIQRIKLCMAEGVTVVLVHCESLYESLYDLLNQHYVEYGGQTYVRLAFGTYTRLCPIHRRFRVVVIVETTEAYTRLAPPLLNRFEKQVFERKDVLSYRQIDIVKKLERFAVAFASAGASCYGIVEITSTLMRSAFAGYHGDILSSLVLSVSNSKELLDDTIFSESVNRLLWIATPEATCRLITSAHSDALNFIASEYGINCATAYFNDQRHSSLSAVFEMIPHWSDSMGAQIVLMTHAPSSLDTVLAISRYYVQQIVLHELDQERELRHAVEEYFKKATDGSVLLVQCDPVATSRRRIEHTKFLVELCRARRFKEYCSNETLRRVDFGVVETKCDEIDASQVFCDVSDDIRGIHVVFLIHLPRGDVIASASYNVDFDTRWRHAFIDAIHPSAADGLPDTETMIGRTLLDVFKQIDVKKTLTKSFRLALAKMDWAHFCSNDDLRKRIETVLLCLDDADFVSIVSAKMASIMENNFGNIDFNIASIAQEDRELLISGTFQAALHKQIYNALSLLFAVTLSHMMRNSTLDLFLHEQWKTLWLYLFETSFKLVTVLTNLKKVHGHERVIVRNDDRSGGAFRSQFPFSFFLVNIVECMRPVAEQILEIQLYRQFLTLNLDFVSSDMTTDVLHSYCYDMVCMLCKQPLYLNREEQCDIIFHCLSCVVSDEPLRHISQLHYRLWKYERSIELLCESFNCSILDHATLQRCIVSMKSFSNDALHDFFNEILRELAPWNCEVVYATYVSGLITIRPTILSFIELLNVSVTVLLEWQKTQLCFVFIRDVGMLIDLPVSYTTKTLRVLEPLNDLTSLTSLRSLFNILCATNKHIFVHDTGIPPDFFCPLTLEKFVDPVIAADGFTYERRYIEDSFARGNYRSPKTNVLLPNTTLISNTELINRMKSYCHCDLNSVLEFFIFDILFSSVHRKSLNEDVLRDLVVIASGCAPNCDPKRSFDFSYFDGILPSSASIVGILREIFAAYDGNPSTQLRDTIMAQLRRSSSQYLDSEFCSALLAVIEDYISVDRDSLIDLAILHSASDTNIYEKVETIAKCRKLLSFYADDVADNFERGEELSETLVCHVSDLLSDDRPMTHHIKMFFLKQLLSRNGISYLRSVLLSPTLSSQAWIQAWKKSNYTLFARFLGANRLPTENPFLSFPLYRDISSIVCKYISTSNERELSDALVHIFDKHPVRQVAAALLLVCFNEIALLKSLPSSGSHALWDKLRREIDGILSHRVQSCEKDIVMYFGFGYLHGKVLFDELSSLDVVLQARLQAHLIACTLYVPETHPFAFFRRLLFAPSTCGDVFFPTMPEDMAKMAQNVMGGRWYACPNNHPFYVDQCGRPTRVQKCAECGADIGGENHNLLNSNIDLMNVGTAYGQKTVLEDRSEKRYCLRTAAEESQDRYFTARGLSPSTVRVLRNFLHAIMVTGSRVISTWSHDAEIIFNHNFANPVDICGFLQEHWTTGWNDLKLLLGRPIDEVALILHLILIEACYGTVDLSLNHSKSENLASLEGRSAWEDDIGKKCIYPFLARENLSSEIADAARIFDVSKKDNSAFIAELQEIIPLSSFDTSQRATNLPGLWRCRKSFSLEDFTMSLNLSQGAKEKYPVLYYVLTQERDTIHVLRNLPAVLEWCRLLVTKFNGRIGRDSARVQTVADILSEIPDDLIRHKFETAFSGFAEGWNMSWRNVQKYGCIRFSSDFNNLTMSPAVPISFSLPNEHDEGICPLALIHYLVDKHNALAQLVDESLLLRIRREGATECASRVPVMPSRFITNAHAIRLNVTDNLCPLFEKYCVNSSTAVYNFDKAEKLLVDKYFSSVTAIDLEMRGFNYLHEQHLQGGIAALKQKIQQLDIDIDIENSIRRDIVLPSTAQRIVELLETVVSFLNATGGSVVQTLTEHTGEMLLVEYMKNVLLIQEKLDSRTICTQVRLKHLASLLDILADISSSDPFRKVHSEYKCDATPRVNKELVALCSNVSFNLPRFLPIMKSFIVNSLIENVIAPDTAAFICLENLECDSSLLGELPWFTENFPSSVKMSEIVNAYEILKNNQLSRVSV